MKIDCGDYSVYFGENRDILDNTISDLSPSSITILVDENTAQSCLPLLKIKDAKVITVPPGEEHKNLETCAHIWEKLTEFNVDRKGLLISLGGGVITDMGGFAASTYKRGIKFINIPTSLLAMVDASVGGKTGVDFQGFKNHIGAFSNPRAVFIDDTFLKTLPTREYYSGVSEMIKHALIDNLEHWENLKERLSRSVTKLTITLDLIYKSVSIKHQIVSDDPIEEGTRKLLNFGHTLGHAIESYFLQPHIPQERRLLHGEAVGIGMIMAAYLSHKLLDFYASKVMELTVIIRVLYTLPYIKEEAIPELLKYLSQDKKNESNRINFVLLKSIGKAVKDININEEDIREAIVHYNSSAHVRDY